MASLGWGVITVDLNGVITFINSVACGLSGWKQDLSVSLLRYLKYAMENSSDAETIDAGNAETIIK
jgi:PAS domain-containing protein